MSRWLCALALAIGVTACGDGATAPTRSDAQLNFLRPRVGAPLLANPTVDFYAYYDRPSQARVFYHALPGVGDSVTLVDFTVPAQSLLRRPDGSSVGPGDSVLVTISVVDPVRMIVRFEPSGLQFSPRKPARLRLALGMADLDLTGVDASLRSQLHIWRQERTGEPWTQLPSTVDMARGDVAADIPGFTHYVVAY
jgi:hypothetical protein